MEDTKARLVKAVTRMLIPLTRILLRYDISHSEFSELAKRSYVEAVYRFFSIANRKQTYSRASVLTGLNRKEVVRLANLSNEEISPPRGPVNRAVQVIGGWLSDAEFLDQGQPRLLPLKGGAGSFEALVARYSGDLTARAILDELVRVGAVTRVDKQTVKLSALGYIPAASDPEKIEIFTTHIADLLTTISHNLTSATDAARFQRQVTYKDVPKSVIDEFQKYSHEKSLALLIEFNQWLADRTQSTNAAPDEPCGRVGVGIYFLRNDNGEEG